MEFLLRTLDHLPQAALGGAITIGNFDGVHEGHRALIRHLRSAASNIHGPSIVFTFEPHPAKLLRPESAPLSLTWLERRASILRGLGVDYVVACPTSRELLSLTAADFFQRVLLERFHIRSIVEGPNFRFGHNREGDIELLTKLCQASHVELQIQQPTIDDEDKDWISSTRIRNCIECGDLEKANQWLVEPYRIRGTVVHGAARGRTLGFPTANLADVPNLVPAHGVYAARVVAASSSSDKPLTASPSGKAAAVNIGPAPTFAEGHDKIEVHILEYEGDLYDRTIEIELLARLRGVVRFPSKEALLKQLAEDIHDTRCIAAK